MYVSLPAGDNKESRLCVQLWANVETVRVKQPAEYVVLLWYNLCRSASLTLDYLLYYVQPFALSKQPLSS
jgi:hypothetical protein